MTYELFYAPNTASFSIHWLLVELESLCDITYTLKLVDFGSNEQKSESYLRLNPKGRVPCLAFDGVGHSEQVALAQLLVERHPSAKLAPPPDGDVHGRSRYLETMTFLGNTLLPAMRDWVYADKDGEAQYAKGVRLLAKKRIEGAWERLNDQLEGQDYLLGQTFGVVDILAGALVTWTEGINRMALAEGNENVRRWVKRVQERKSWHEAKRREDGWEMNMKDFESEYFPDTAKQAANL
jgi:glutathione S-transferase